MNCATEKATKLMKELDTINGIGLVERVKQGQGKPVKIYLKKFISNGEIQDFSKSKIQTFENRKSRPSEIESQDFQKSKSNDNEFNNNKYNNIYLSNSDNSKPENMEGWKDRYNKTIAELHKQLDYDYLVSVAERERVDEIVNIMADVMLNYRPKYKIEGETIDYEAVVCNFSKVTAQKLEACLLAYRRRSKKIHNTKAYWITVLYNIPLTSSLALENMVVNDLQAVGG